MFLKVFPEGKEEVGALMKTKLGEVRCRATAFMVYERRPEVDGYLLLIASASGFQQSKNLRQDKDGVRGDGDAERHQLADVEHAVNCE